MAWNSDDGVNRYSTDDGQVFNTEKDAEDHYKKLEADKARAEELAKYLAKVKGICDTAWGLINSGNYSGAVDHLHKNSTRTANDSYMMPWQFFYPMGAAEEKLGSYDVAAKDYTKYLEAYRDGGSVAENNSNNHVRYSRARVYIQLGEWQKAENDCCHVMDSEDTFGKMRNEILGNVFYWRGLCHEKLENKKMTMWDYKLSSDFGQQEALNKLSDLGVRYKVKKPPRTMRGNILFSFINGSFAVIGYIAVLLLLMLYDIEIKLPTGFIKLIIYFVFLIVAPIILFVIGWSFWRNTRYLVYPKVKKIKALVFASIIAVFAMLFSFPVLNALNMKPGDIVFTDTSYMLSEPNTEAGWDNRTEVPRNSPVLVTREPVKEADGKYYVQVEYDGMTGYYTPANLVKKSKKD